jgi:hypothetical protein
VYFRERGGREAEKEERQKWTNAEQKRLMDSVNSLLDRRDKYIAERGSRTHTTSQGSANEAEESELIDVQIKNHAVKDSTTADEAEESSQVDESDESSKKNKVLVEELSDDAHDFVIVDKTDGLAGDEGVIDVKLDQGNKPESIFSNKIEESSSLPTSLLLSESKPAGKS